MANWEATVTALAPLLSEGRPKLTQELLARPPFRFLHDVVSAVGQATGFGAGLFTEEELNPRALDKEGKLAYLGKLIAAIEGSLAQPVPARPSKIVAGLEPEATNIMLQMLAAAAQRGPPAAALVAGKQPVAAALAGPSAGTAAAAGGDGADAEGEGARAAPHVAFARQPLDRLLPALARQLAEARSSLSGGAAAPGGQEALARCQAVQEVAANAAVLARSLEALQGCARAIAVERDAWRQEAAKLATRLQEEERAEAAAAAASAQRMAALDARLAVSRQHLGVVCGLRR